MKETPIACLYARTSREDKHHPGLSIPDQLARCRKMAEERGYSVPKEFEYKDEGVSSTVLPRQLQKPTASSRRKTRKGLSDCLDTLLNGKANALFIRDVDRLGRRLEDTIAILNVLLTRKPPVELILTDSIIPSATTAGGKLLLQVLLATMEYALNRAREYGKTNWKRKVDLGQKWGSASALYGFDDQKDSNGKPIRNGIVINPKEEKVVQHIFDAWVNKKYSLSRICRDLDLEYPLIAKRGRRRPWQVITVRRMLQNPKYAGLQRDSNRKIKKSVYPNIVDISIWRDAQTRLKGRPMAKVFPKRESTMMTGLVRCDGCGDPLLAHRDKSTRYVRYYCTNRACSSKAFPMLLTEWQRFWTGIIAPIAGYRYEKLISQRTPSSQSRESDALIANLEASLREITEAVTSGKATYNETFAERRKIEQKLEVLISANKREIVAPQMICDFNKMSPQEQNEALHETVCDVIASRHHLYFRIRGLNMGFTYPLLHIWGTHKYRFSLLPSPYLLKYQFPEAELNVLGRAHWSKPASFYIMDVIWAGYTTPCQLESGITVLRNEKDSPLSYEEVLASMRAKIGRRQYLQEIKMANLNPVYARFVPRPNAKESTARNRPAERLINKRFEELYSRFLKPKTTG